MKYDVLETPWKDAIELEQEIARIIHVQQENGWLLDSVKCKELIDELNKRIEDTDNQILPLTKPRVIRDSEVSDPFRKDGTISERVRKYFGADRTEFVRGPFSKIGFESINLGSVSQVKEYLFSIGWQPDEWNIDVTTGEKTSPRLTSTSLLRLGTVGELLDHRTVLTHRRNQLEGFLRNVREDGRIEARATTIGTPTMRMRQSIVVNVPKAKDHVFFGKEMRSIFTVPEGYWLVGGDAGGLENRCVLHYLNNPVLIPVFIEGDFHTKFLELNKDFLSNRDNAKTAEYALLFEAKDWKLGDIAEIRPVGLTKEQIGAMIRASMDKLLPGLNDLIKRTQLDASKGWIAGLDGRKIRIRHAPFNSLIQSCGAIFMKRVLVILMNYISKFQIDAKLLGTFHDEFQFQVRDGQEQLVKCLFEQSVKEAERYYNFRCPMIGEVKISKRWSETH